ncbi:MAG: hypothetical protein HY000_11605 [Planctomycetes bacterium]|nr:hypothetical protein [Planctomycetota bacterium]
MVRIGIVGLGFMGMIHFYGAKKLRGGKVTAICTRNPRKLAGDWSSIQGNFGPRGSRNEHLAGVARYSEIAPLKYGKLIGAHFKRIISKPTWSEDIASLEKTGGPGVDLHIHDTHFIGLVCGVPKQVYSRGTTERGYVQYLTTHYLYDDLSLCVTCSSGAICQPGRPFVHGYEIYFEKATLLYESGTQPLAVLTADGKTAHPKLGSGDPVVAFTAELQHAVKVVSSAADPAELSGELARDALLLCQREAKSVMTGRPVAVS